MNQEATEEQWNRAIGILEKMIKNTKKNDKSEIGCQTEFKLTTTISTTGRDKINSLQKKNEVLNDQLSEFTQQLAQISVKHDNEVRKNT